MLYTIRIISINSLVQNYKCAEVLVPDCVDTEFIGKAYVSCRDSKIMLERIMRDAGLNLNVEINADLFFG